MANLQLLQAALGGRAQVNESLAPRTTFRIGGPADLLIETRTIGELVQAVTLCRQAETPYFILGNGSNILVRFGGIRGLVIENHCEAFTLENLGDGHGLLHVESGAPLPLLANRLSRMGWSGLEWAIGIPGTIGGAIVGNAGAYGECIGNRVLRVQTIDAALQQQWLPKQDLRFDYRASRFKSGKGEVVLAADLELKERRAQECLVLMGEYTARRKKSQPTEASVGSIFKNPPGDYAGRLIEQAGLKGLSVGPVQVSTVHGNFFVNHGGATASDVLRLIDMVRERVRSMFAVDLELEIQIVGENIGG